MKEKAQTPLEEAIAAKQDIGMSMLTAHYECVQRTYMSIPMNDRFPFIDEFINLPFTTKRKILPLAKELVENNTYWVITSAFTIMMEEGKVPFHHLLKERRGLEKVLDSYYLSKLVPVDYNELPTGYKFECTFKTKLTDLDGGKPIVKVVVAAKKEEEIASFSIWQVGYYKNKKK